MESDPQRRRGTRVAACLAPAGRGRAVVPRWAAVAAVAAVAGFLLTAPAGSGAAAAAPAAALPASPAAALPASPAAALSASPAAAPSACTSRTGVLVVVDLAYWGRPVERGCDPSTGSATTGYDALHVAGFTTAGDAHDGDAFVCRIDGLPTPGADSCQSTPFPPDSWSYWHAAPGATRWTFSQLGATSYHPPAGSIDAWVFGSTAAPAFTPAQARAGTVPASTATTPASTGRGTSPTTALRIVSAAPPARTSRHSSPVGPLVAAGVVAVLVSAAVLTARRRRASGTG